MSPLSRIALSAVVALAGLGFLATTAMAAEHASALPKAARGPLRIKLRTFLPLTQLRLINPGAGRSSSAGISLWGASVEGEYRQLWALEFGGASLVEFDADYPVGYDVFARGGVVPVVYDGRDSGGRGWTIQLDALAGYRWIQRGKSGGDGYEGTMKTHALRGNIGIDFTRQYSEGGISVRLLSGLTFPLAQSRSGDALDDYFHFPLTDDLEWALDTGIDLGVAF